MSFSDMMSSARGPGVIGTLMALAVMGIFIMFSVLAFDDRYLGGGQPILSVIADQELEIAEVKEKVSQGRKALDQTPARENGVKELARFKRNSRSLGETAGNRNQRIDEIKAQIAANKSTFEDYKNQYREYVRNKARGEEIPSLTTQNGTVYQKVTVREVTAIGIQIRHESGHKRLPFEDLPPHMQDRFQFDADQKILALAEEDRARSQHEAAVDGGVVISEHENAKERAKEGELQKERIRGEIRNLESQVHKIRREIEELSNKPVSTYGRSGPIRIENTTYIANAIRSKHDRIIVLEANISRLRSNL